METDMIIGIKILIALIIIFVIGVIYVFTKNDWI